MNRLRNPFACALLGFAAAPAGGFAADPLLAPGSACPGQRAVAAASAQQERALRCLVRWARREAGLRAVRVNARLERSSQAKADLIARCGVLTHTPCGQEWDRVFSAAGFRGVIYENLAAGSGGLGSARNAMAMWLRSPGHRQALLADDANGFGVGLRLRTRVNGWRGSVWVLHLGRPA